MAVSIGSPLFAKDERDYTTASTSAKPETNETTYTPASHKYCLDI